MPLTDTAIRGAKPGEEPIRLFGGDGLYLKVPRAGSKLCGMKHRFDGKDKRLSPSIYPDVACGSSYSLACCQRSEMTQNTAPLHCSTAGPTTRSTPMAKWRA
jgi:hypothetical protein